MFVFVNMFVCLCVLTLFSRCFGLLLSPGKNVKNSDMHLLDLVGECFHMCMSVPSLVLFLCAC